MVIRQEVKKKKDAERPLSISNIARIAALKKYTDNDTASSLLHQAVKLVAPIIHKHNFKVGTLCEMFPKNPNLLGLNLNRGQKILIRLRYHYNSCEFYPIGDIVGTLLHELTHNLYGKHDQKFYKFMDELREQFDLVQMGNFETNYRFEEQRLGSLNGNLNYESVRDKRIKAVTRATFKWESRKLGSIGDRISKLSRNRLLLRELVVRAAERRLNDSKWCAEEESNHDIEPSDGDLKISEINSSDQLNPSEKGSVETAVDIVDLTDDYEDKNEKVKDIIIID